MVVLMEKWFRFNDRLKIWTPDLDQPFEDFPVEVQEEILSKWEHIRGMIPDRIALIEKEIEVKQGQLSEEADFETSCLINESISELASQINDLWIFYRTEQHVQTYVKS